ncbi:VOC family protein [Rufibacter sediminis]|uniref:VOC family protein n=1 Tax=Rufibacter sediminis TaxID=2762756 RepID=A0ABR6VSJ5_9BACT|nr:VOC family protein [Rufibacter sediminis]MBC3540170.1 VOC family protein [Rufibacter sediminis]
MTTVNTYLYFNGNCEEAFDFYKSIFNKDFQYIGRYKDVPEIARQNFPYCTDEQIMHIALPISKETILMGADIIDSNDKNIESTNNFSLYLSTDSKKEAERLFNSLCDGGKIKLPLSKQFWGSYYGICLDKFGINWKISFSF